MPEPLTGAQLTILETRIKDQLLRTVESLQLRKYAMQCALEAKVADPLETAKQVYAFLSEPATEVVIRIEQ